MTLDEERRSLLDAVLDAPEDDAPRLIYADWLEEYGSEADGRMAEFIRAQCDLGDDADGRPHWPTPLSDLWIPLHEPFDRIAASVIFRRGFLEEVSAPLGVLLEHGPKILRQHPVTRMVATDRRPRDSTVQGQFAWDDVGGDDRGRVKLRDPDDLPSIIWRRMTGHVNDALANWKRYTAYKDALEAMYAAVLEHCRELARKAEVIPS